MVQHDSTAQRKPHPSAAYLMLAACPRGSWSGHLRGAGGTWEGINGEWSGAYITSYMHIEMKGKISMSSTSPHPTMHLGRDDGQEELIWLLKRGQ